LDISQLEQYVGEEHTWRNVAPTASFDTFRGGKHGYTEEAGRTLAALFEEELAEGGAKAIAIIFLGSDDLKADIETLRSFLHTGVAYR
ncbi:MAG: hypothetical protein U1A28_05030, partial [Patescibacteria group bacterium]|nr:hypothetical protein [Patescibacteria group bacterium]